jgi:FkbM family methyltransferase
MSIVKTGSPDLLEERLRLASTAAHYDLCSFADRQRAGADLAKFYLTLQAALQSTVVVEVGAFSAAFSRDVRTLQPDARVVAFEANPYNHSQFASEHGFEQLGIEYLLRAVSDRDGTTEFLLHTSVGDVQIPQVAANHSLLRRTEPKVKYEKAVVETVRLDTYFADELKTDATFSLWVDVEGATRSAFAGASGVLAKTQSIMIEVEEHAFWKNQWLFRDVHQHLGERGFRAVARDFEQPFQFNVVFVHESRLSEARVMDAIVYHYSAIAGART